MSVIDVAVVVGYLALMLVIGYFSGKDGESCSFDLCEECFDEITKGFLIPTECKDE